MKNPIIYLRFLSNMRKTLNKIIHHIYQYKNITTIKICVCVAMHATMYAYLYVCMYVYMYICVSERTRACVAYVMVRI